MKTQSEHSLAAKAIRAELKKEFPGIKFAVTSSIYAGGTSVRISYSDGPLYAKVTDITEKYQEGSFNGMEDIYEYTNKNADLPQVKYVMVNRDYSEETKAVLVEEVRKTYPGCENITPDNYYDTYVEGAQCWASTLVHRVFSSRTF